MIGIAHLVLASFLVFFSLPCNSGVNYKESHNTFFNLPDRSLPDRLWTAPSPMEGDIRIAFQEGKIIVEDGEDVIDIRFYIRSRKNDYVFFYEDGQEIEIWPWMILKGRDIVSIYTLDQFEWSKSENLREFSEKIKEGRLNMTVGNSCIFCHLNPEITPSKNKMTLADIPEKTARTTCTFCHNTQADFSVDENRCIYCHSGDINVPVDEKREGKLPSNDSVHASQYQQVAKHPAEIKCLECHTIHKPENLISNTNSTCVDCHEGSHMAGKSLHDGKYDDCTSCHIELKTFKEKFTPTMRVLDLQMYNHDFSVKKDEAGRSINHAPPQDDPSPTR